MVGRIARYRGDNQWQDMAEAGTPEKAKEARAKVAATLAPKAETLPSSTYPSPAERTFGVIAGRGPSPDRSGKVEKQRKASAVSFKDKLKKTGSILYDMSGIDHIVSGQYLKDPGEFGLLAEPGMGTGWDGQRTPEENDRVTDIAGAFGMDALNVAIGSSPFSRPSNSVSTFLGPKAKGAPLDTLEIAKRMEAAGTPAEEIWRATAKDGKSGWWKAPDGRWRWEIPDNEAKLTGEGRIYAADPRSMDKTMPPREMPKLYKHDQLYEAMPEARNTYMSIANDGGPSGQFQSDLGPAGFVEGYGSPFKGGVDQHGIAVGAKGLDRIIPHEGQHLVDFLDNNPNGGMPGDEAYKWIKQDDIAQGANGSGLGIGDSGEHRVYLRNSGEGMANLTDKRVYMDLPTRVEKFPGGMMNYPAEKQWVREPDGSIWVPDGKGGVARQIRGPQKGWKGRQAGSVEEAATTPPGGAGGPPRRGAGDNGGPPMRDPKIAPPYRQDYDPLEVIMARAEQVDMPMKNRVKPSGQDPLFDTSREAYERTKDILPQQRLPSPRVGSIEELKGALARSRPLAEHADAIAGRIAEKIAPYKGTETQYFYNMAPVYEKLRATGLTEEESLQWLHDFGAAYGGTSPRTNTENNIRNAFLLLNKRERGMPFDSVEGPGTIAMSGEGAGLSEKGFPMMANHRSLTQELLDDVDKMNTNPKPSNFKGGAAGNLQTVTADTHAIRGVLVAFNELRPGEVPAGWFKTKGDYAAYTQDPVGWFKNPKNLAEKINDSLKSRTVNKVDAQVEYGVLDDIYRGVSGKAEVQPAEGQSLGWFTSGEDTNLGSAPHSIPTLIDQRVDVTAQLMGVPKEVVWQKLSRFKTPVAGISGLLLADKLRRAIQQDEEQPNAY
jgi:hypothetical protein